MLRKPATQLFEDYADAYARGERPNTSDYLDRAGPESELLAQMIDKFLQAAPPRAHPEDGRDLDAWLSEPPLLRARVRRRLSRENVVDRLVQDLSLDERKREKVHDYYHRLETGLLDPDRVDRRVYEALSRLFKTVAREYVRWQPTAPQPTTAYYRADEHGMPASQVVPRSPEPPEPDEIDRLFTAGDAPR